MPHLVRRRSDDQHREVWHVYYDDVQVGSIGRRAGVPHDLNQWGWNCGFYPGLEPHAHRSGSAADFAQARAGFAATWERLLPQLTEANFAPWRRKQAHTAWKYAMWQAGCRLPSQVPSGRSRCICGADITTDTVAAHIDAAHMRRG